MDIINKHEPFAYLYVSVTMKHQDFVLQVAVALLIFKSSSGCFVYI